MENEDNASEARATAALIVGVLQAHASTPDVAAAATAIVFRSLVEQHGADLAVVLALASAALGEDKRREEN